jgi:troponin T, fast skeletal muscle
MVCRKMNVEEMLPNDIKDAVKKLHQRLNRLEGEKYDLEKRHQRQDYDVKKSIDLNFLYITSFS